MSQGEPLLDGATFVLSQKADSMQEGDECQVLTVEFLTPDHHGHFMRLHTGKRGWAIESPEDMEKTLRMLWTTFHAAKKKWEDEERCKKCDALLTPQETEYCGGCAGKEDDQ